MNNNERTQIAEYARKGMNLIQLEYKFRPITITEIKKICDEHHLKQKQNDIRFARSKVTKRISKTRKRKDRIQSKDSIQKAPTKSNKINGVKA